MPGGDKEGGGLKSSPVYKMKEFSGFGESIKVVSKSNKNTKNKKPQYSNYRGRNQ